MNMQEIQQSWSRAYTQTIISYTAQDTEISPTVARLHLLYMRVNPYAMLMVSSVKDSLQLLDEYELRDFFLRLTSRFSFNLDYNKVQWDDLYRHVYNSANIHHRLGSDTSVVALNLLGSENEEQCMTLQETVATFRSNRWFLVMTLFSLIGNGK